MGRGLLRCGGATGLVLLAWVSTVAAQSNGDIQIIVQPTFSDGLQACPAGFVVTEVCASATTPSCRQNSSSPLVAAVVVCTFYTGLIPGPPPPAASEGLLPASNTVVPPISTCLSSVSATTTTSAMTSVCTSGATAACVAANTNSFLSTIECTPITSALTLSAQTWGQDMTSGVLSSPTGLVGTFAQSSLSYCAPNFVAVSICSTDNNPGNCSNNAPLLLNVQGGSLVYLQCAPLPTFAPTFAPTVSPTAPTAAPTAVPTVTPSAAPTGAPSVTPQAAGSGGGDDTTAIVVSVVVVLLVLGGVGAGLAYYKHTQGKGGGQGHSGEKEPKENPKERRVSVTNPVVA